MTRLNSLSLVLSLVILLVGLPQQTFADSRSPLIVQPAHTLPKPAKNSGTHHGAPSNHNPTEAYNVAKEIRTKAPPKQDSLENLRELILNQKSGKEPMVKAVRESQLLNALHEAIDEKIVDQSFIQTLASVGEPPLISDYTRDTLLINSIKEDVSFTYGENVFAWKTAELKNGEQHVIVGLSKENIVILYEHFGEYSLQQVVPMKTVPAAFEVITVWDSTQEKAVSCLVVATELSLVWYTMRSSSNFALTEEWRWPLHKMTTSIKFFKHKDLHMVLLVGTHPNPRKTVSATLYEYDFEQQQFWLMQKLQLNDPCKSVGLVSVDNEFLVAFPQNNMALIYLLTAGEHYRGKFSLIANFTSEQVHSVGAFQIGRYSYVAIGGKSPQILRYSNGNFTTQLLPTHGLETVEAYYEIPTHTYRDDLILLVQHKMIFSTHELQRLDVLVWDGESFDIRSNIPCYVENEITDNEVSCLLDLQRPTGIVGSTIVKRGKHVSMIVPRYEAHSSLFHLQMEMLSGEHPITQKVNEIRETIDAFNKIVQYQDSVIHQAMQIIDEARILDEPLVLLQNCSFGDVNAGVAYQHTHFRWPDNQILVGNVSWTYEDTGVNIPRLEQDIEYEMDSIVQLEHQLKFAVRKHNDTFSLDLEQPLHVQGHVEIGGSLVADDLYVRRLEEEPFTSRITRQVDAVKELRLQELKVRYLNFETVNGIPANQLIFNTGDKIVFEDKLIFEGTVVAQNVILPKGGTVNGVDLSESAVYFNCKNRRWNHVRFDYLEVLEDALVSDTVNGVKLDVERIRSMLRTSDTGRRDVLETTNLQLDGSLYFQYINGIPWSSIIQHVVLKNRPNRLVDLRVEGQVILEHPNITVYHLNERAFPDDYLLSNGPKEAVVTGFKRFVNTTYIDVLDVEQTVNGVDLRDVITLMDDQHIPGNITFGELHVTDRLEVLGSIRGKHLDKFLDNPTLLQTNHIKADCHFKRLHVDGPIIVKDTLDGIILDEVLGDVVYDSERNVVIESTKKFGTVEFAGKLIVESNTINDIPLEQFITTNTEQTFNISEIHGNIFIENLTLGGLFDGINVTLLDMNSIKLFGDQHTEASLIIKNPKKAPYPDVEANELRIGKKLNSRSRSSYIDTEQEEIVLTGDIDLPELDAYTVELESSAIEGPLQMINDVHLPTFDNLRFSLSRPQDIGAPFRVDRLVVNRQIWASYINNRNKQNLRSELDRVDNYMIHLLKGNIPIENLFIEGDLQVALLNDVNFNALLQDVIWLNRPNEIHGLVQFLDPLIVQGNVTVDGLVNKEDFREFLSDAVYRSSPKKEFHGTKIFANGLTVDGDINTDSINNIRINELAVKNKTIYLRGDVVIDGALFVDNLKVESTINGDTVYKLQDLYHYDTERDMHVIKGDMKFKKCAIQELDIRGALNHIPKVDAYLGALLRKDQDYNFTKPMLFKNEVTFDHGFQVTNLNGYNISNIDKDIVRINDPNPVEFYSKVIFEEPVYSDDMTMQGDLIAPNIAGCNPDDWATRGVMINKDVEIPTKTIFAPGALQARHASVEFLNGFPMSKVITLNTPQDLESMHIYEMTINHPLEVHGLVNGVNFPYERKNTLMTYGNQRIRIPTVFNSIRVLESLTLPPILNGKLFGPPVVLGPKMVIQSPISFRHLKVRSLETEDMISGVDFNHWHKNSVWHSGRDKQVVPGKLMARHVQFNANAEGNGKINGVDINDLIKRMRAVKKNVENQLHDYRSEFRTLCSSTQELVEKTQDSMYFFKYFVQRQLINEHRRIESFFFFDHMNYYFLAINTGCESFFYQWDPIERIFMPVFKYYTGRVEEWEAVVNGTHAVYVITRSPPEDTVCKVLGLSVWLVTRDRLEKVWNSAADVFQAVKADPFRPTSFYVLKQSYVREYAIDGDVVEQWELPNTILGYRFIPSDVGLGLAVSDGKLLVLLSSANGTKEAVRRKRNSVESVGMALFSSQSMVDRMTKNDSDHTQAALQHNPLTDSIEPSALKPKPLDQLDSNSSILHVNEQAPAGSPIESPLKVEDEVIEDDEHSLEMTIAKEIPFGGVFTAENQHFPDRVGGDIVAFLAGPLNKKRHLVAISTVVEAVIKGEHDAIKIYTDIQAGELYQVLPCHRPSHLTALELRDETILAFLESLQTVQIYIYRGMQGFVRLSSFNLVAPAIQMGGVSLPQPSLLKCKLHYLAIATQQQELILLKAKTQGNCGMMVDLECDTY